MANFYKGLDLDNLETIINSTVEPSTLCRAVDAQLRLIKRAERDARPELRTKSKTMAEIRAYMYKLEEWYRAQRASDVGIIESSERLSQLLDQFTEKLYSSLGIRVDGKYRSLMLAVAWDSLEPYNFTGFYERLLQLKTFTDSTKPLL